MRFWITGGELKGRAINCDLPPATRPTSQKHRGIIFNVLKDLVETGPFLDAFSGTGCVGLEALSRGAPSAVFVEKHPGLAQALKGNLQQLGLADRSRVITGDFNQTAGGAGVAFGVIFLDPPYQTPYTGISRLHPLLQDKGILIVEKSKRGALPFAEGLFQLAQRKQSGDTEIIFLVKK
jgi:16S rRNA (guanine966-N2)-methyltransferase